MVILGVWVDYAQGGARRTGLLAAAEMSPAAAEASRACVKHSLRRVQHSPKCVQHLHGCVQHPPGCVLRWITERADGLVGGSGGVSRDCPPIPRGGPVPISYMGTSLSLTRRPPPRRTLQEAYA
jgi:hypothetical protein